MDIIRSTAAYERWLHEQLRGDLVQMDLDEKHARMADGAFRFLRATYWRWAETILTTCPELADAPSVLAVGDIHVENFGSWLDREGRLVWGVNDFDEAAKMPYVLDLVRLAASATLAGVRGLSPGTICASILKGYREGLADPKPFVLDREHEWLREIVVVPEEERHKFWEKFDPEKNINEKKGAGRKRKVPARYVTALESALPDRHMQLAYWPRTAGTGSLGRPRWIGYGLWQGAPVVREAKAVAQSGWARAHDGALRLRCAEIATGKHRSANPWYGLNGEHPGPPALSERPQDRAPSREGGGRSRQVPKCFGSCQRKDAHRHGTRACCRPPRDCESKEGHRGGPRRPQARLASVGHQEGGRAYPQGTGRVEGGVPVRDRRKARTLTGSNATRLAPQTVSRVPMDASACDGADTEATFASGSAGPSRPAPSVRHSARRPRCSYRPSRRS